jgi:putative acetyltransferase
VVVNDVMIRTAVATDVDLIMATHLSSISEICSLAYTPEDISAWTAGGSQPERYLPGIATGRFIVAMLEDVLVGFSDFDLEHGEVCGMFVAPSHVGQGIGRALLEEIETRATRQGVERLHVQASLNAIGFYEARGFVLDRMARFHLRSGVSVPCAVMHKNLSSRLQSHESQ